MRAVKPRAAAPPMILTAFEAALLELAVVPAEGLELDEEEGEVADEAVGDVDVTGGTEEVRVTPAARHVCWATSSAFARSLPLQLASKH